MAAPMVENEIRKSQGEIVYYYSFILKLWALVTVRYCLLLEIILDSNLR